jgi:hypothetical protein
MERTREEEELIALADEMSASIANLNQQTYSSFIEARSTFIDKLHQICSKQYK